MPFRSISLEKLSDSLSTQVVEESGNFLLTIPIGTTKRVGQAGFDSGKKCPSKVR